MTFSAKSVYLAGPITGLSYGEAKNGWRAEFAKLLAARAPHIECYSPMRSKEFLSDQQNLECRGVDLDKIEHALSRPLGILTRDGNDVAQRDAVVACFLGAQRVSIGTVWEIGFASAQHPRKPIIVVMEKDNIHDHVFITHSSGYVVETLDEAALITGSLLTPGV